MRLLANATAVFMALPVNIRLISHNIRFATTWPTTGEGEDIVSFEGVNDRLTTLFNSIMGGPEAPSYCTVPPRDSLRSRGPSRTAGGAPLTTI